MRDPTAARQVRTPRAPRAHRVRGQLGAAAVERQAGPAAAERRHAAVPVLQIEQPADAGLRGVADARIGRRASRRAEQMRQREERAGRVVGVGHAAGEIGPRPPARRGVRVGMLDAILLAEDPVEQRRALGVVEPRRQRPARGERFDRQRRRPRRQVGVDRPAAVVADGAWPGRRRPRGSPPPRWRRRPSRGGRSRNAAPAPADRSSAARLITTKLVSGVASRKPPVVGWMARSVASVRRRVAVRASQVAGLRVGRIWCRTWPMAMSAGSA